MKRPNFLSGLLAGLLLTIPHIAILFVASVAFGLAFATFDMFDLLARVLPGDLIRFGIGIVQDILIALGLSVRENAKGAEATMAIMGHLTTGAVAGGVFFALLRARNLKATDYLGFFLGAAVGLPVLIISAAVNTSASAPAFVRSMWILVTFMAWGVVVSRTYDMLEKTTIATKRSQSDEELSAAQMERRQFLIKMGGATAAITVVGAGLGGVLASRSGGSAGRLVSVSQGQLSPPVPEVWPPPGTIEGLEPAPGTRPEITPLEQHYRIDISLNPPRFEGEWSLPLAGLVDSPTTITLDDLQNNFTAMDLFVTQSCISNRVGGDLVSTQRWTGVSMQDIVEAVQPDPAATHINITCKDGFHESVSLDLIRADRRIMLAYAWDGVLLPERNGYPARIYIPDRYGMKQPKWITTMDFVDHEVTGYWVKRGWSHLAQVQATSVVDTATPLDDGMVAVGGVAYAGARGISAVEVRVDGGEWQAAQLRTPLSELTWTLWRFDWPFEEGTHVFEVRTFEGDGTPQIERSAPPAPDGATGIDSLTETLA